MNQEIQAIITKNLPEEVGKTLRDELQRLYELESDLQDLEEVTESKEKELKSLRTEVSDWEKRRVEFDQAMRLKEEAEQLKKEMDLKILNCKLEESDKRHSSLFGLLTTLMQNPRAIELINISRSFPASPDQFGNPVGPMQHGHDSGEIEKKEIK